MSQSQITVRYAKALLATAKEQKILSEIRENAASLRNLINTTPELKDFFEIPIIKPSLKLEIINKSFKDRFHPVMLSFLRLIVKNNREHFLPLILLAFEDLFKKDNKIKSVLLTTPKPVNDKTRTLIKDYISKEFNIKIELTEKVNDKLIGGFILRIEDQQINASVSNHLNKIRSELLNI
jgi:F-type H+-transporting ATPase subunit delta